MSPSKRSSRILFRVFVEIEAATRGEYAEAPLGGTLVVDHDARECAVTLAVLDEDEIRSDMSEFSGLDNRAPGGHLLKELDEFPARGGLDVIHQPAREPGGQKAQEQDRYDKVIRAEACGAQGEQFAVGAQSADRQQHANQESQRNRIRERDRHKASKDHPTSSRSCRSGTARRGGAGGFA